MRGRSLLGSVPQALEGWGQREALIIRAEFILVQYGYDSSLWRLDLITNRASCIAQGTLFDDPIKAGKR